MILRRLLLATAVFLLFARTASATHSMGADLTYRSLGNNQYEITLTFYRDCVGIQVFNFDYVRIVSSCFPLPFQVPVQLIPGTGNEITPLCPSALSTCNGGTFTGIQQYVYRGIVTLPGNCTDWTISYNLCCRNAAITTIPNPLGSELNVFAVINNTVAPSDNSPVFSNLPVPFVCMGQQFCFSHGAYDADGDSIVYQLIPPRGGGGVPLTYLPGFSAQQPLTSSPGMTFNPATGDFCFTPQMMEVTVMAVLVNQYRNGVFIGSVERDIQVTVINCSNVLPQASGINGTNNFSINACANQQTCFTINTSDADGAQNVTLDWDNSIPGATFTPGTGSRPTGTFCWTPSQSDIGTSTCFTATVTDNACPIYGLQTFTYCINVQGPLVNAGPDVNLLCNGPATTTLTATASNGNGGNYNYQWSNGSSGASTTAGPGTYVVAVTNGGCTSRDTVVVNPPPPPPLASFTATSPCQGSPVNFTNTSTPAASINQTRWNFGGGNNSNGNNPSYTFTGSGTYNVTLTVTDANGCTSSVTQPVTVQPPPVPVISPPTAVCDGQSATLTVSGGGSYSWSPGGQSGSSITVTPAQSQSYNVTVTSAAGCTATATVAVTVNPLPIATVNPLPTLCAGASNGSATVLPSGGTSPYSYSWSSGASGATAANLAAGSYSVTVTDANGCTVVATTAVVSPPPVVPVTTALPAGCNGASTGSVSATASGGTGSFAYSWTPGGSGSSLNGLPAGTYTVTATDANGCTATTVATVSQPAPVVLATSTSPAPCNGAPTGSAGVTAAGGTPGYSYSWSSGSTASTTTGLAAGPYSVTVTDNNGCSSTATVNVAQAPPIVVSTSSTMATCGIANGSVSASVTGGTPGYQYAWSPGGMTGATANNIVSGSYTVTITDANGCTTTAAATVSNAGGPTVTASVMSNVPCFGGTGGSASVQVTTGNGPFTITWPGGATGSTATNLPAGVIPVTVTDVNGCVGTDTVTITQPTPLVPVTSAQPVLCSNASDGSVAVNVTGGTPGYAFSWSPSGATGTSVGSLPAGSYTVTITDNNGCTSSATAVVAQPAPLSVVYSTEAANCAGTPTGSASVAPAGGTPGYTYLWSNGATGAVNGNIPAGTYSVTVTDNNGCSLQQQMVVSQPTPLAASTTTVPALCGSSNGSASVTVSGGTPVYTYSWTPGGSTSAALTNLPSGAYTVTVTDAAGCTQSSVATVSNSGAPLATASQLQPVSCFGGTNGSVAVAATGGATPYTYSWNNGATTSTASNLPAGTYSVTVTDAYGCISVATVAVTQPTAVVPVSSVSPVTCYSGMNGSVTLTTSGGTAPYSYVWSNGAGTNATAGGLSSGTYTVTVTDANGCSTTLSANVPQPGPIVPVVNTFPVTCNGGASGSATASASGGTAPYSYSWSTGAASSTATGLAAGAYPVTVTDANGCTSTITAQVVQPSAILLSTATQPALCGSANGSASVTASGGTPGYSYAWAPGGSSGSSVSNLASGAYVVTVTDAVGCTQSTIATVSNSGAPVATASQLQPVSCFGGSNGSVTVVATGGAAPYVYNWNNGVATPTASNLPAGNYSVTVTDAYGCISVASVTVVQPAPIVPVSSVTQVSCHNGNDGAIVLTTSGGTSPYAYNWSNGAGNGSTAAGLSAGNYSVTVTDANGCTTTLAANVPQPTAVVPSVASFPATCNGGTDGSATVSATGGTGPYTYSWSSGAASATATGLASGSYSVTVTDANGCTGVTVVQVAQPSLIQLQTTAQPALCGSTNGSAAVVSTGGTPGYSFAWSPAGGNAATAIGLGSGQYTVAVTDNAGCLMTATVVVPNIGSPIATVAPLSDVSCSGGTDGSAVVLISSGTAPYSIAWPGGVTNDTVTGLAAGAYQVMVTDANGCITAATVQINQPAPLVGVISSIPVDCNGSSTGSVSVQMAGGVPAYSYQWSPQGGTVANPTGLPAGQYAVVVTDANGCLSTASVTVTEPTPLSLTTATVPVSCNGYSDGAASVVGTGGTGAYSYSWTPAAGSGPALNSLPAGNYTVTLTDASGCTASAQVPVSEPPPVSVSVSGGTVSCFGYSDGQLQAVATGGNGPYQYDWMPGNISGGSVSNLPAGNYTLTVTDQNGCSTASVAAINAPAPLSLQVSTPPTLCIGQQVTLATFVSGGTQPYAYTWSNGATSDTISISPASSTSYSVNVTDANGCTAAPLQIPVSVYPPLQVQAVPLPAICGGDSAYLDATAAGGNGGPYSFSWNNGSILSQTSVIHPFNDSLFTVTVDDGCSPPVQTTVFIDVNPLPVVAFTPQSIIGCSPVRVQFANNFVVPPGSTFQWDLDDAAYSSNAAPVHTYTVPGTYDVSLVITTPAGCTAADTVVQAIQVFGNPIAGFEQSATVVSELSPDVTFYDESSGAVSWFWDFGDGFTAQGVQNPEHHYQDTGTYFVRQIVMNEGGCLDTVISIIRIEPESSIFIPNAFTPNGDNHNEGFIAVGRNIIQYEMWIIDRWGREIYHAVDFQSPWDGTYYSNGNPCQNDVYEYVIDAVDIRGKKTRYIGHVTLVR